MIQRDLLQILTKRIDYRKAIILFGPRQVGKTTLVKKLAGLTEQSFIYVNGDDLLTRTLWESQHIAVIKQSIGNKKLVIVDEAQMITNIGLTCKQLIDEDLSLQLVLTGSSALDIANMTQEPLTGRKWEYFLYQLWGNYKCLWVTALNAKLATVFSLRYVPGNSDKYG
jgi:predicted AAA+ superfamily ATPase